MAGEKCAVCQLPASQCCSGCHTVYYCSRDHQKQDWRAHKSSCQGKPYKTCRSPELGRYFRAARDIKEGETILKEHPVVLGPKMFSRAVCLGCNRRITSSYTCAACNYPMCGPQCELSTLHVDECNLMQSIGFQACIADITKPDASYSCITPLRCLLKKDKDKTKWEALMNLESHLEERRNTTIYSILKSNTSGFFSHFPQLHHFTEETILTVCAILDTNCFEVSRTDGGVKVRGVYPVAAIMSHDCTPNTKHIFTDEDFVMNVIATVPIKQGDIISTTYTHTLWNTIARQRQLKAAKCFDCVCKRCTDPTEFGTYLGSILCPNCKNNNEGHECKLISTNPHNVAAPWKCESCSHTLAVKEIESENNAIKKDLASLNMSNPLSLEKLIDKYKDTLHPTNGNIIELKYALSQMYGASPGYSLSELSDELLDRKEALCKELLKVADVLDPGSSHLRGALLLEQQAVIATQAKRTSKKAVKQELTQSAIRLLKEANEILSCEQRMLSKLQQSFNYIKDELITE